MTGPPVVVFYRVVLALCNVRAETGLLLRCEARVVNGLNLLWLQAEGVEHFVDVRPVPLDVSGSALEEGVERVTLRQGA